MAIKEELYLYIYTKLVFLLPEPNMHWNQMRNPLRSSNYGIKCTSEQDVPFTNVYNPHL